MSKTLRNALRDINAGKLAPVVIITGDEDWAKGKVLRAIKKAVIDPGMADFNFDQFRAEDISGTDVVDKAGQLPMMADRRLVVVEHGEAWKAAELKVITKYLDDINEKTCLVLMFSSADRRRKLFQNKSNKVCYWDFPRPRRWELNDYISALAADQKIKLDRQAIALVAELAGDDIARVHCELEKLSLYKLDGGAITIEDVEQLMGRTRQVTRWELGEFLGKRDLGGALMKVHAILDSGEEPISLLSAVSMCFKQLFVVKALMMKGIKDQQRIAPVLGVPPRIAGDLIAQQKNYSDWELRRAFTSLRKADFRLKSAGINRALIIDDLVAEILMPSRYTPPAVARRIHFR